MPTSRRKPANKTDRAARWKRVGAFIRSRREDLGLDQKDLAGPLGYARVASVSNIERGVEGVPYKRIFQWADILHVPRDSFYRMVSGEPTALEAPAQPGDLDDRERSLLHAFQGLPKRYQDRLLEAAREFEILSRVERRKAKS